ncbi:zinc-ribbon domain-containing protein [Yoonia sp. 2307UL14-13]|uniref:zinc-ribbon domain-containing protein n=1 Tax=Yoonia sp. 2307UL14-13 TaxID=3126506 RepID=UPI0030A527EA
MRLICPKCNAQYDIADDVIPEGGRDVQCSSCAHTWFQMDKPKVAGRPLTQRPTPKPATRVADDDGPRHQPIEDAPQRQPLDSSIADILREEAAHEQQARATEEAQPHPSEKAGQSASERAAETRKRIAQMTEEDDQSPAAVAAASTGAVAGVNVRTMPDIDEINATLRARATANDDSGLTEEEQEEIKQRRGFRRGFFFVLILIAILIAPYFFVDQILENLPQTAPYMETYVQTVDNLRVWLDNQIIAARELVASYMEGSEGSVDAVPATDATTDQN